MSTEMFYEGFVKQYKSISLGGMFPPDQTNSYRSLVTTPATHNHPCQPCYNQPFPDPPYQPSRVVCCQTPRVGKFFLFAIEIILEGLFFRIPKGLSIF
jgi:hypothetical protein